MKVLESHFFRAVAAAIIGALLIEYREQTVTWITIAIGILFFLSGVFSIVTYYSARKNADGPQLFDAEGKQLMGKKPAFPIVGIGSVILGGILALMPNPFITGLTFLLASMLILGAISQLVNLAAAKKFARIGIFYWIIPSLLLLVGLVAIIHPTAIASAPLFVIGWCLLIYGVIEAVNALKVYACRKSFEKNQGS